MSIFKFRQFRSARKNENENKYEHDDLPLVQKQNPLLNLELGTQLVSSSTQFVLLWVDFSEIDSKYIAIPILH